jgi:hypothetical protein
MIHRLLNLCPTVKAAIAAARARKQQQQQQLQRQTSDSTHPDAFSTPNQRRTPVSPGLDSLGPGSASKVVAVAVAAAGDETDVPEETEQVLLEWGGKTTDKLLSEAKRTGQSRHDAGAVVSRMLTKFEPGRPTESGFEKPKDFA